MAKIGYLRVSTEEQRPDRQIDALRSICDEMHIETVSALSKKRPVYNSVIRKLQAGDTFIIWEISRAYRNVVDAIKEAEKLQERGVNFQIGTMQVDLSTPEMEFAYIIMAASAQLEVTRLKRRTQEGMEAARKRGVHIGRLSNDMLIAAYAAITEGDQDTQSMAEKLGCSESTLKSGFERLGLKN